jgi:acyl-ACP thioesterase
MRKLQGKKMYEFDSRVRYSEVDSQGELTWLALMDYFQDCSVFHSEKENLSVEYLAENHIAWVLSSWQICSNRMPRLAEQITTQTWAYGMKSFYGYRNFVMKDEQGQTLAYANSVWVLVDTQSGRPVKVPEEMGERYGIEPQLPMECSARKIALPDDYEERETICVPSYFIDTNQHMNNSHYVQVALGYLPDHFVIGEVRVEYRKAAKEGDMLYPRVSRTEDGMVTALCDEAGKAYAVVEFINSYNS